MLYKDILNLVNSESRIFDGEDLYTYFFPGGSTRL